MTNFVFSRRDIQRAINNLAAILATEQLEKIVNRLNLEKKLRLQDMWEVVLLDAASHAGELRHEVQLPNTKSRPDIELFFSTKTGQRLLLVGDIETISDAGLNQQNPVDEFSSVIWWAASKAGIDPHCLHFEVFATSEGECGNRKTMLLLPSKGEMHKLVKEHALPWMRGLKQKPQTKHEIKHRSQDGKIEFQLKYDPKQRFASGSHLSYKVTQSLEKNPLYNALKGKKDQLRGADPDALRIVFACDGDCNLLRNLDSGTTKGSFGAEQVAEHYLKKNSTIDAVLLIGHKEQIGLSHQKRSRLDFRLVVAPLNARSKRMTPGNIEALRLALNKIIENLPRPLRSPGNANIRLIKPGTGPDMIGAINVGGNNGFRISSRAVQRLLAGEITTEEFQKSHGWLDVRPIIGNPFKMGLEKGEMISKVEVEHGGELDDDWLVFNFGQPDPAAGPFAIPGEGKMPWLGR